MIYLFITYVLEQFDELGIMWNSPRLDVDIADKIYWFCINNSLELYADCWALSTGKFIFKSKDIHSGTDRTIAEWKPLAVIVTCVFLLMCLTALCENPLKKWHLEFDSPSGDCSTCLCVSLSFLIVNPLILQNTFWS